MKIAMILLGLFLLALGGWQVVATLRCRQPVTGRCVDSVAVSSQGVKTYAAVFEYQFEGQSYRFASFQSYSKAGLRRRFKLGEDYPLYLDPRQPGRPAVSRLPQLINWLLAGLGLLMVLSPILP